MHHPYTTESGRRLRSSVRAVMSSAVWFVVSLELVIATLRGIPPPDAAPELALRVATLLGLLALLFYSAAGTFYMFARTRDVVPVQIALRSGYEVFAAFLQTSVH